MTAPDTHASDIKNDQSRKDAGRAEQKALYSLVDRHDETGRRWGIFVLRLAPPEEKRFFKWVQLGRTRRPSCTICKTKDDVHQTAAMVPQNWAE
jgi:hypothetical protein